MLLVEIGKLTLPTPKGGGSVNTEHNTKKLLL